MKTVGGEKRSARKPIALCERCQRDLKLHMKAASWQRAVHRAPGRGMIRTDPAAERQRQRKARKAEKRAAKAALRAMAGKDPPTPEVIKVLITTAGFRTVAKPEDCEQCKAMQDRAAGRAA